MEKELVAKSQLVSKSSLEDWDELNSTEGDLYLPDLSQEGELIVESEVIETILVKKKENTPKTPVAAYQATPSTRAILSPDHEAIACAMLTTRGDLAKASRLDSVDHNAMSLRAEVKAFPEIRARYHELLAEELQEKGLHIAERILRMAELQDKAMGQTIMVDGPDGMEEIDLPADPKMVIELSKEISRLIAEGKGQNMSAKTTVLLASKEDAIELLAAYLNS